MSVWDQLDWLRLALFVPMMGIVGWRTFIVDPKGTLRDRLAWMAGVGIIAAFMLKTYPV